MSFVHLHTHSEFSLLDGANRIPDLVKRAKQLEMPALALTDHGCLYGAWAFHKAGKKEGLKPIIGMEAYVAPGSRKEKSRSSQGEKAYYHLVLLARDMEGYKNLVKLSSIGYTEGFYGRPRVDREVLAKYSNGIVVSSACMAGEVARHLLADNWDGAREAASWYANLFDGRYYLEVQAHDSEGQKELNSKVFKLADEMGLPVVATNDAHFLKSGDHEAHDVLLCIGLGKDKSDPNRMRYDKGLYFKDANEIAERFPDRPDVLTNTLAIADTVRLDFTKTYHLPAFPLPETYTDANAYLEHLARGGVHLRYGLTLSDEVQARFDYELGVIKSTGYAGYFLIVSDLIQWAKAQGIPVGPGRGSAAGSIIAYALGITNLDPLLHDLLFERFLNPERISMPDIDIDFCFERRGEVIDYVRKLYGSDAVGQIITFGTMKSRAVIRDVGRTLGFEPSETDRIAKLIPNAPNQSFTVEEAVKGIAEIKDLYKSDERHKRLFDYCMTLEGLSRHASVHAAGVVIAPGPISDYVPVCIQPKGNAATSGGGKGGGNGGAANGNKGGAANGVSGAPGESDGSGSGSTLDDAMVVTQYDFNALDDVGILKIDFLGLKTLTVIHDAVEAICARVGDLKNPMTGSVYESMDDVPLDDPTPYRMLAKGGTAGIFQFESSLAIDKLRAMRCDRFEDLVATTALIRPGPLDSGMDQVYVRRKLGLEPVKYPHPALEKALASTFGIIVYQEQVLLIPFLLAGYSLGEADVIRKAVGKKIPELIKEELGKFVTRAVERGVDKRVATDLAEQIETFGRYGFNRAHAAAYAVVSYQTAWLKVYYPAEFMAALLSSVIDHTDDVVAYIAECKDLPRSVPGLDEPIEVLAPDVNQSGWKFTAVNGQQIRFGLGAVRGVGSGAVKSILEARSAGQFTSLFDFLERIDLRALNKRACEALVAAGALDAFGHRAQLFASLERAYQEASARRAEQEAGQASLFGGESGVMQQVTPTLPNVPEWPEQDRLAREKEALGFFISGHPLDRYRDVVHALGGTNTRSLGERAGQKIDLPCVVTGVARQISRKDGSEWGKVTVEDFHGTATVLSFKDAWQSAKERMKQDAVVLVKGMVSSRERDEEDPPIFLDEVIPLDSLEKSGQLAVQIDMEIGTQLPADAFAKARVALNGRSGMSPLELLVVNGNGTVNGNNGGGTAADLKGDAHPDDHGPARLRSRTLRVDPGPETLAALREVFGKGRVRLVKTGG